MQFNIFPDWLLPPLTCSVFFSMTNVCVGASPLLVCSPCPIPLCSSFTQLTTSSNFPPYQAKQTHECNQHCCRGLKCRRSPSQCSDHTHGCHPRRKPLLMLMNQKVHNLLKTSSPKTWTIAWITGPRPVVWPEQEKLWLRWCSACVTANWRKVPIKTTVSFLVKYNGRSIMVQGCMNAASTGEFPFMKGNVHPNMNCDILKQRMTKKRILKQRMKLARRGVFQQDNDPKHTFKKLKVKVLDRPGCFQNLNL